MKAMATGEETREAVEESFEIGGAEDASGSAHGGKAEEGMTPWEQHAAVINLPRYDYAAPSSLLHESRSGFLITCPISEPFPILCLFFAHYARQNPWLRFVLHFLVRRFLDLAVGFPYWNYYAMEEFESELFQRRSLYLFLFLFL